MFGIVSNIVLGLLRSVFGITRSGTQVDVTSAGILNLSGSTAVVLNSDSGTRFVADAKSGGGDLAMVGSGGQFSWSSSAAAAVGQTPDTGLVRVVSGVVKANDGASADGWVQNAAGHKFLAADVTNATATMANLTGLSATLKSGRKYGFRMVLFVSDSTAAEGAKFDFDGGTVTITNFRAHGTLFDTALVLSTQSTALATDFAAATVTGAAMAEFYGTIEPSADGTFIPRAAQNSHVTGTLTVARGSHLIMWDIP